MGVHIDLYDHRAASLYTQHDHSARDAQRNELINSDGAVSNCTVVTRIGRFQVGPSDGSGVVAMQSSLYD